MGAQNPVIRKVLKAQSISSEKPLISTPAVSNQGVSLSRSSGYKDAVVSTAQGNVTLVRNVGDTIVPNFLLNETFRSNRVTLRFSGDQSITKQEIATGLLTGFMVGQNLSLVPFDYSDNETNYTGLQMSFDFFGQLSSDIKRSNKSMTKPIDTGRVFDIVELPFSTVDAIAVVITPIDTTESNVLKDLKGAIKINVNHMYDAYIGRCKSTLTDAYTPFDSLSDAYVMFVDEVETLSINL